MSTRSSESSAICAKGLLTLQGQRFIQQPDDQIHRHSLLIARFQTLIISAHFAALQKDKELTHTLDFAQLKSLKGVTNGQYKQDFKEAEVNIKHIFTSN